MKKFHHAIVVGGSLGGMLAARILSNHFEQVTIIERDQVIRRPESRKGQPQTRHLHGLLHSGYKVFARYFPDLPRALAASGATFFDFGESWRWYTHGGYRRPFHAGWTGITCSRPLLEHLIRERTLAVPQISLRDRCSVKSLVSSSDKKCVSGVEIERRDGSSEPQILTADLVVDCTGRGSRTPRWLKELGYEQPATSEVNVNVGYATRYYKRDPNDPRGSRWMMITPEAPKETRFAAVFPIEGDRWIASVGGWHGDHGPTEEAAFLEFARQMPAPDIYDIIRDAEPISEITPFKFPFSLRRHYEKLRRFPEGYLVLGDAFSSFNPTYGQGMSSAALQAETLDAILSSVSNLGGISGRFFREAAKVIDIPWTLAVGEDFRFPRTTGPKPPVTDLINKYVARVHVATHYDPVVGEAFAKVMNLMAKPTSLVRPGILWRVFRRPRTGV